MTHNKRLEDVKLRLRLLNSALKNLEDEINLISNENRDRLIGYLSSIKEQKIEFEMELEKIVKTTK